MSESLIAIVVRDEHPLNALFPIDVTFDKSGKYDKELHPSNVLFLTTERLDVPAILTSELQFLNEELPNSSIESGNVISVIAEQFSKALSPMLVTSFPAIYSGTTTEPDKPLPLLIIVFCPLKVYVKKDAFVSSK